MCHWDSLSQPLPCPPPRLEQLWRLSVPPELYPVTTTQWASLLIQVMSSLGVPHLHSDTHRTSEHSSARAQACLSFQNSPAEQQSCPPLPDRAIGGSCLGSACKNQALITEQPQNRRGTGELPPSPSSLSMAEQGPSALLGSLLCTTAFPPVPLARTCWCSWWLSNPSAC